MPGAIGGYACQLDADLNVIVFAVDFEDRQSDVATAGSTQMDADFRRLRALLIEEPLWEDGEITAIF